MATCVALDWSGDSLRREWVVPFIPVIFISLLKVMFFVAFFQIAFFFRVLLSFPKRVDCQDIVSLRVLDLTCTLVHQ